MFNGYEVFRNVQKKVQIFIIFNISSFCVNTDQQETAASLRKRVKLTRIQNFLSAHSSPYDVTSDRLT